MTDIVIKFGGYEKPIKTQVISQGYEIEDEWAELLQKYNDNIWELYCNHILDSKQMNKANERLLYKIKQSVYKPEGTLF